MHGQVEAETGKFYSEPPTSCVVAAMMAVISTFVRQSYHKTFALVSVDLRFLPDKAEHASWCKYPYAGGSRLVFARAFLCTQPIGTHVG